MPGTLTLKIITPERIVLDQPVGAVIARGTEGEFEVLPGHEPLVATLGIDVLRFNQPNGEVHSAAVMGGVLEVRGEEVTVLSDVAELDVEIDSTRASQAKERALAEKTQRTDKLDVYVSEMAIGRAVARLRAAELHQRRRKPGAN
jgi:F-type H+-transporting ATPase subunit epsilon